MYSKHIIVGRLGQDPKLNHTQSGIAVCNFSIAEDRSYIKDGSKVDKVEWHKITCWNKQAENCAKYLGKGSMVMVEGQNETRKYQDQQGQDKYTTEIKAIRVQFLDSKGKGQDQSQSQSQQSQGHQNDMPQPENSGGAMDDVPF